MDDCNPRDLIEGAEKVERIFGRWPRFHDAEVLGIVLDRGVDYCPTVRLSVHAFELTAETDARGYFIRRNHVVVTFVLHGAEVIELTGFNHQNVLFELLFSRPETPVSVGMKVQVDLDTSFGVEGRIQCARAEVVSVEPLDLSGSAAPPRTAPTA